MQSSEQPDSRRTFLVQLSAICAGCGLPLPFQPAAGDGIPGGGTRNRRPRNAVRTLCHVPGAFLSLSVRVRCDGRKG